MSLSNLNKDLVTLHMKQNVNFYLQTLCLVSQYVCLLDIHIVKHIIHIKTLIDSGAIHVLLMKTLVNNNTLSYYAKKI